MAEKKAKTTKKKELKEPKKAPVKEVKETEVLESEEISEKDWAQNETAEFSGKYLKAIGRRKRAVAQVRLYEGGKGVIMVNGQRVSQYFPGESWNIVTQPLKVTGRQRDFNFSVIAKGGGKSGQLEAVRLGISRAILAFDPATKEALKANGFLTRDPRQVERKKPGLRKARKRPQWSKR